MCKFFENTSILNIFIQIVNISFCIWLKFIFSTSTANRDVPGNFDQFLESLICPPPPEGHDFIQGHDSSLVDDLPADFTIPPPSPFASNISDASTVTVGENDDKNTNEGNDVGR